MRGFPPARSPRFLPVDPLSIGWTPTLVGWLVLINNQDCLDAANYSSAQLYTMPPWRELELSRRLGKSPQPPTCTSAPVHPQSKIKPPTLIVKCNAPSHSRIKLDNKLMCCPEMRALTKVYDKAHARGKVSLN